MPFPIKPQNHLSAPPIGTVKQRTYNPTGLDGMTGPSYSGRCGNTNVVGTTKSVRRYGVAAGNRGEWKR